MKNITRLIALPVLSAGIIGGATLGLAGPAAAEVTTTTTNGSHSIVATPDKSHYGQQMHPYKKRHRHHFNQWHRH
ncbi:hypothetical protein [Mycolicibacterium sp.]|uniref:hypothetical protein n=1 Tax=Mycolicibacterium sp. TaxID=2320850 RepID=UPI003D10C4CF